MNTRGLKIIQEMSKEELIGELLDTQRAAFEKMEENDLRHILITMRTDEYRRRLHDEAGFEHGGNGVFGA